MSPVDELLRLGEALDYIARPSEYLEYNVDFVMELCGERGVKLVKILQERRMGFVHIHKNDLTPMIADHSEFFDMKKAKVLSMGPQYCYENSEFLYRYGNGKYTMVIGRAFLTSSWVSHAWVVDNDNILHETTPQLRDDYYGVPLKTKRDIRKFEKNYL